MVAYAFNAAQVEPKYDGGGGLPANPDGSPARYKVIIASTEAKPTRDGQGGYVQLALKCIEGPYNGTIQYDNLNLHNKSQQAVEIANKQLSAYCHVTGKFAINDTDELCNIPFQVDIGAQKNNPLYSEVKKLYDINGNEPGKSGAGPAAASAPQPPPNQPPPGNVQPQGQPAWGQAPVNPQVAQPAWNQPQGQPPAQPAQAPPQGGPSWGAPAQGQPPAAPSWGGPPQGQPPQGQPAQPAWGGGAAPPAWGQR